MKSERKPHVRDVVPFVRLVGHGLLEVARIGDHPPVVVLAPF